MAINLNPPPIWPNDKPEEQQYRLNLYNYVRPNISTSGDAAATIPSGATYHGVTALTAGRTLTLPPATSMNDGDELLIQDESGSAGTYTITISAAGTDTISGTATISSNYGRRRVIKRGAGKYFSA